MNSPPNSREKHFLKKDPRFNFFSNTTSVFFYFSIVALAILFSFHLLFYANNEKYTDALRESNNGTRVLSQPEKKRCDLFKGKWFRAATGSSYTNYSCNTIPLLRNCFLHGREDRDFLQWRWKPEECELPRFSPVDFLAIVRGKTMAFIGDSLARNQMDSLLCLLSKAEAPQEKEKDGEDGSSTWEFPDHNFTLMALRSNFLVAANEVVVNGSFTGGFHLNLDEIDSSWSEKLPDIDYAIFSDAHWFFRQNYLYEHGRLIGCIYCQDPGTTDLGPGTAIRKALRAALDTINRCKNCRKIFALVRTYSPSHFENGTWNTGGGCNRTLPIGRNEVDESGAEWGYRQIQMEEVEIARKAGENGVGNLFEILDIMEMMMMRPDGHPGEHWGNIWMKGYSDCIHWCLPGPIDVWNELLLEVIKRQLEPANVILS